MGIKVRHTLRSKRLIVVVWLCACIFVMADFLQRNYTEGAEFSGTVESRIGFLMLMVVLTFPSGFMVVVLSLVLGHIFNGCCSFGPEPGIFEVIGYWIIFVAFGYVQWFVVLPVFKNKIADAWGWLRGG